MIRRAWINVTIAALCGSAYFAVGSLAADLPVAGLYQPDPVVRAYICGYNTGVEDTLRSARDPQPKITKECARLREKAQERKE